MTRRRVRPAHSRTLASVSNDLLDRLLATTHSMFANLPTRKIQSTYAAAAQLNQATHTGQINRQVSLARRSGDAGNLAQRAQLRAALCYRRS